MVQEYRRKYGAYYKNNQIDSNYTDLVQCGNDQVYLYQKWCSEYFLLRILLNIKNGNWYYVVKRKTLISAYTGLVTLLMATWYYIKQGVS